MQIVSFMCTGLINEELEYLASGKLEAVKTSRRDLAVVIGKVNIGSFLIHVPSLE